MDKQLICPDNHPRHNAAKKEGDPTRMNTQEKLVPQAPAMSTQSQFSNKETLLARNQLDKEF